jgi:pimeloyl-ACP methyl ester carboxylesterase
VDEVRRRFTPDPSRTFIVGVSEGGLVAALAADRHPDLLVGAEAASGPVRGFAAQMD